MEDWEREYEIMRAWETGGLARSRDADQSSEIKQLQTISINVLLLLLTTVTTTNRARWPPTHSYAREDNDAVERHVF